MSAIARAIQSVNINPRSFFIAGAVLLGVFGLFVIPELVGNSTPRHHPMAAVVASAPDPVTLETAVPEAEAVPAEAALPPVALSPLDHVLASMETKEQAIDPVAAPQAAYVDQDASPAPGQQAASPAADARPADDSIRTDPITWQKLSSPEMIQALNNARSESLVVAQKLKSIPTIKSSTLFALLTYQNGIRTVSDGGQAATSFANPEEALSYLEQLDADVTKRLVEERVGEDVMERWTRVSLGPLLSSSRAARMKERLKKPFNPQLTIGHMRISVTQNGRRSFVALEGYLRGETAKTLSSYRNGKFFRTLRLEAADDTGWRYFSFLSAYTASGVFTFRVEGEYGEIYEKSYRFLPNISRFRQLSDGSYEIPLNNELGPEPRLDRLFSQGAQLKVGDKIMSLGGNKGAAREPVKVPKGYVAMDFAPRLDGSWESF